MSAIYLGRIVAVAVTPSGKSAALYRVSSRSFPNRMASVSPGGKTVSIIPRPGHEADVAKSPYIAYNAARLVGQYAVLANGSHTDPVAEKIAMGFPVRDALALSHLAMDYEKDSCNTPRITAVADARSRVGWLATVRADGLDVRSFPLEPGRVIHLSTYEHAVPEAGRVSGFVAESPEEACEFVISGGVFKDFTNAVSAVAAVAEGGEFRFAVKDIK